MTNGITIEISSPAWGYVQQKQVVNGFIQPPGPLQVFVLDGDNKWRLQPDVRLDGPCGADGAFWSATCDFGSEDGPHGTYGIVAISGNQIWEPVLEAIPQNLPSSKVVRVHRPARAAAAARH